MRRAKAIAQTIDRVSGRMGATEAERRVLSEILVRPETESAIRTVIKRELLSNFHGMSNSTVSRTVMGRYRDASTVVQRRRRKPLAD
jgi:hypothetical protein